MTALGLAVVVLVAALLFALTQLEFDLNIVASLLTLVFLPTLYVTWFGRQEKNQEARQ